MATELLAREPLLAQPKPSIKLAAEISWLLARAALVGLAIFLTMAFLFQRAIVMAGAGVVLTCIAILIAFPTTKERHHRTVRTCAMVAFFTIPLQALLPWLITPTWILQNIQRDQTATYPVITAKDRQTVTDNQAAIAKRLAGEKPAVICMSRNRIRFHATANLPSFKDGTVITIQGNGSAATAPGTPPLCIPVSMALRVVRAIQLPPTDSFDSDYAVKIVRGNFPGTPFNTKDWISN